MAEGEISLLVERLAEELYAALWIRRYGDHMEKVRSMRRPSEKLIYLFLLHSEPQSFTSIRRALSLSNATVDEALKRLLAQDYVIIDESYLYWVSPHLDQLT